MEASRHFGKSASGRRGSALSNRRTAILVAAVSALLAAVLIYLFVSHYQKNTVVAPPTSTVWVAKRYIPAGTPQSQIAASGLLKSTQVPASQAVLGAITDPSAVAGQTTSVAIEAGQQVTAGDYAATSTANPITAYIKGDQRGVAFTLDSEHGLTSYLQPGNTVDIMALKGSSTELLLKDVTVIANSGGIVVLRLTDKQALIVTAASAADTLWLSIRPTINATNSVQVGAVGSAASIG